MKGLRAANVNKIGILIEISIWFPRNLSAPKISFGEFSNFHKQLHHLSREQSQLYRDSLKTVGY